MEDAGPFANLANDTLFVKANKSGAIYAFLVGMLRAYVIDDWRLRTDGPYAEVPGYFMERELLWPLDKLLGAQEDLDKFNGKEILR